MSANERKMTRKDVAKAISKHRGKILNWFFANIGLGLMPIWLAIAFYWVSQLASNPSEKIIKGDLILFVTTLCASSLTIFSELKDNHFKDWRDNLGLFIYIFIIISAAIGAFVSAPEKPETFGIYTNTVFWISFPITLIGVSLSLTLFIMKLTLDVSYADDLRDEIDAETNEANSQTTTSDGKKV